MKDSGVEWLGAIPANWDPERVKRLFQHTKRQGFPEQTVLSVYREYGVIEKSSRDDNANRTPEDVHRGRSDAAKVVAEGQVEEETSVDLD